MTAVALFDVLAGDAAAANDAPRADAQLLALAQKLVANGLTSLKQLEDDERQFAWSVERDPAADLQVMRTVWRLYLEWSDEAERVLARVRTLRHPEKVARVGELHDAFGRIRARLTVTPEQLARAKEQVRQGQIVPAKELRNELHARLRS